MRENFPVTSSEKTFPEHLKLVSSTDLNGKILHCNDSFTEVSGFSRDELIGQPHNIVRHPDMPPEAYKSMWLHLKAGLPWMGLVKNRCKNGDFYWVSAYVTPVTENGEVVGYESVRSCPVRADVLRAEKLYRSIRDGRLNTPIWKRLSRSTLFLLGVFVVTSMLLLFGHQMISEAVLLFGVIAYAIWLQSAKRHFIRSVTALMGTSFTDELAVRSYTDDGFELGRIKVAIRAQQAHLDAVLTRIEDSARSVKSGAIQGLEYTYEAQEMLRRQQAETEQVAGAVHQMSQTIAEVSENVQQTADKAEGAREFAEQGSGIVASTRKSIEKLKVTVHGISQSVRALAAESDKIAGAAKIIEDIAEQTNLLALNAAIEAARAGEHGRGFAVVADEVRNLARRTQSSTREIHRVIDMLLSRSTESVRVAEAGSRAADDGLERMLDAEDTLHQITESVATIAEMAIQMAAAVEEQSQVSDQINEQVGHIAVLASGNLEKGEQSITGVQQMGKVAGDLHELVVRFK